MSNVNKYSLKFASAQYFTANKIPVQTTNGSKYTLEFWMYYTPIGSTPVFMYFGYSLWIKGTLIGFNTGHGDCVGYDYGNKLLNKWVHIAAVMGYNDASKNKLYIDGVLRSTGAAYNMSTNGILKFGGEVTQYGDYSWAGYIDEIRVWDIEIPQEQIQRNMHKRIPGGTPHLIGYWTCDEDLGKTVCDHSSTGIHATLTGATRSTLVTEMEPFSKTFIQDGNDVKKFDVNINDWTTIGDISNITVDEFINNGMEDISIIPKEKFDLLNNPFKILSYSDDPTISYNCMLLNVPHDKIVLMNNDIELMHIDNIDNFKIVSNIVNDESIRIFASVDCGTTWKTFNGTEWVDMNLENAKTEGMTPSVFNVIDSISWNSLRGTSNKIRFGYTLSQNSLTDNVNINTLELQADMRGRWHNSIKNKDYAYSYDNTNLQITIYSSGDYKINYIYQGESE